jgi:hypothetical protein
MSDDSVLRLVTERKLAGLLPIGVTKNRLEASGVVVRDECLFVVFDNFAAIARIGLPLSSQKRGAWLGEQNDAVGFEDIAFDSNAGIFYLLIEASRVGRSYRRFIVECDAGLRQIARTQLEFSFESANRGFEGLTWIRRRKTDYLLALCEGNRCKSGKAGRRPGGGRIQLFEKRNDGWQYLDEIKLPPSVMFEDYSALDARGNRVAVLSQTSSKLWIGSLVRDSWEFADEGVVYTFPPNDDDEPVYCNVEGVAWLSATRLAIVSDRVKADEQPRRCREKDQSVHIFSLPLPAR